MLRPPVSLRTAQSIRAMPGAVQPARRNRRPPGRKTPSRGRVLQPMILAPTISRTPSTANARKVSARCLVVVLSSWFEDMFNSPSGMDSSSIYCPSTSKNTTAHDRSKIRHAGARRTGAGGAADHAQSTRGSQCLRYANGYRSDALLRGAGARARRYALHPADR